MSNLWKPLLSLLLIAHFAAVLAAVLAPSSGNQPAPQLAVAANRFFQPYLQPLFLSASFRFYAPNPGPISLNWYRVVHADGRGRWVEFPRRSDFAWRTPYQRALSMTLALDLQIGPDAEEPSRLQLTPLGRASAASIARHVAGEHDDPRNPVRAVEIYSVRHRALEPSQIAAGWTLLDLRLYRPCLVGSFDPQGRPPDDRGQGAVDPGAVESSRLAARVCRDLAAGGTRAEELDPRLPEAVRDLLRRHPELLAGADSEDGLKRRIEQLADAPRPGAAH